MGSIYDVIIVGGGPAGLAAGLYCARNGRKVVLVEGEMMGGQALGTEIIENYPGFPKGISGAELAGLFAEQALDFGLEVQLEEVCAIDLASQDKKVKTESVEYVGTAVIIATGARPRTLPITDIEKWEGRSVHYCATCDGAKYQGKSVIVVGGGNSAVEEADYLTRYTQHVTVIHEFNEFQASKIAQERALNNPKIEVIWGSHVKQIVGDDNLTGVMAEHLVTGERRLINGEGVFVYIGMDPQSSLVKDQVEVTDAGYIVTDKEMRTNVAGVFAAGDIRDKETRQVATAVGDGVQAAMSCERYLHESGK